MSPAGKMDHRIRARKDASQVGVAAHRGYPVDSQKAGDGREDGCIRLRPDTGGYFFA
jgi:hypothetical protein